MFVTDIRKEFYDKLRGSRTLVIVHQDVDSACACRILLYLLRSDHALYSLVSISRLSQLKKTFQEHANAQTHNIVLINCGGTVDLLEYLEPSPQQVLYVADSHRPLDIYNIYNSSGQICLLAKVDEEEGIPAYQDVFRESSSEDESDEDEEAEDARRRFDESRLTRKKERREWRENRARVLFEYSQFTYYGPPSSLLMFDLCWRLSKDSNETLWLACVGLTEQFLTHKVERENYALLVSTLQSHVSRLNAGVSTQRGACSTVMRIAFEEDLNLNLYRHWTLFDALRHTPHTACRFRLWTIKGEKRVHEFLAELGLPLVQCRQTHSAMDVAYRNDLKTLLQSKAGKYELEEHLVFGTFSVKYPGARFKLTALDYALALQSLLENPSSTISREECFSRALKGLAHLSDLEQGIAAAKLQLGAMYRQVQALLDLHQIIGMGPFLYAAVGRGNPDAPYLAHPNALCYFARFTLFAYSAANRTSKRIPSLPFLLAVPLESGTGEEEDLFVGIPPLQEESPKNLFGKAFEQALKGSQSRGHMDFLDSSIVTLKSGDRTKFLDALVALMT